jgi:twitching motility protein PilT
MASVPENQVKSSHAAAEHAASELNALIRTGKDAGASDVHLQPDLPAAYRVSSGLVPSKKHMSRDETLAISRLLLSEDQWQAFLKKGSADLARTIEGVRCRFNIFETSRGVGLAIRLLASTVPTIETLNLHPSLKDLCGIVNGLVLISGSTGSGKSTTVAALVDEINQAEPRHIITLEYPIEFEYKPHKSFIRQREIERDTPSMQQGLLDSLREDPDVVVVGEMRDPETMRLTLNAAETGHLVFATMHSGSCIEALARIVSAFPAEIQSSVAAQLGNALGAIVCQRLPFHKDLGIRIPECEILRTTPGVKNEIRRGEYAQITNAMEMGAESGMWTFDRYCEWVAARSDWHIPSRASHGTAAEPSAS